MMFVDFLIRFLFVLMPQNVDPSSFQNTPLQWGKMNEWCTKWNAHPGLFCHALSSTILGTNAYHFIWRFVKTKIFTLCNVCPQKYTVYRLDMVAACNGFRMSLENNDDALLLLLARVMIQLGTKDTAYKIQTKYAAAALRTSSKSPILPDLPPIWSEWNKAFVVL